MKDVWPDAYLPKEKRAFLLGTIFVSVLGALFLAVGSYWWSWGFVATGYSMMLVSGIVGPRRYLKVKRKWPEDVLWGLLGIAPFYQLHKSMSGPRVSDGWMIGLVALILWTLFQAYIAWFLWHSADQNPHSWSPIDA